VHPRQFNRFNRAFYERLEQGDTVETAMQFGRRMLEQNTVIEDAAGFGWFTLVTGPRSEIRLVPQRARGRQEPTPKRGHGDERRDVGRAAGSRPPENGDAFSRPSGESP
jgi:hypothetical protein